MNNTHIEQPIASSAEPEMICTPSDADHLFPELSVWPLHMMVEDTQCTCPRAVQN